MTTEPINLVHKVIPSRLPSDIRAPTLLMLHGRGADENDLAALAPRLDGRFLFVSVRAPYTFQYGGFTWYTSRQVGSPDLSMFQKSYTRLTKFLDILPRLYAVDARQIFLFGFSMGAVMAYALALTMPDKFRGVVAHSGYIPEATGLGFRWKQLANCAFFVAHGANDTTVPVSFGQHARELLLNAPADLTYKEYPSAHEITDQSLRDLSAWLTARIGE